MTGCLSTCRSVPVGTTWIVIWYAWKEMEQSMRIVEAALRDIPPGPVQVNPETGRPIPAAEMVDLGKVGNIAAISGRCAVTGPTLEGASRDQHPSIAADEKRVLPPFPRRTPTATSRGSCSNSSWS